MKMFSKVLEDIKESIMADPIRFHFPKWLSCSFSALMMHVD